METLEQHPLPRLLDAGVLVTVNSDDPAYFGGYVADNYLALHRALGLDRGTLEALAQNSLLASFGDDESASGREPFPERLTPPRRYANLPPKLSINCSFRLTCIRGRSSGEDGPAGQSNR